MTDYFYFLSELTALPVAALIFAAASGLRRTALMAGVSLALISPISVFHEGSYWMPGRLFGGSFGVEDVMFCLRFGTLAWIASFWRLRQRVHFVSLAQANFAVYIIAVAVAATGLLALSEPLGVMRAFIIVQSGLATGLLALRPELALSILVGTGVLTCYYAAHLWLLSTLLPGFTQMWTATEAQWRGPFGFPLEELFWVASATACISSLQATVLDARLTPVGDAAKNQALSR